ncbi:DUF2092 domain-containing protein, partial [Candidatus Fermentibacteria bacterium]|nr:DUF2092 domain-containing protein [Candidatus Fermentibacteria bacterium]
KVYWEANRMRVETYTVAGVMIEIQNGKTLYAYNPAKKEAVKTTLPSASITVQARLEAMAAPIKGGKKVGTETVSGLKCSVFILSTKQGNARVHVSTDSRFPLKMKTHITKGNASETTEIRNLKLNYNVTDALFALPKGTKVVEAKAAIPPKTGSSGKK